jgi:hypothetical protein
MVHDDKRRPAALTTEPELKPEASQKRSDPKFGSAAGQSKQRAKLPAERPFDVWLQKQLHAMYEIEACQTRLIPADADSHAH